MNDFSKDELKALDMLEIKGGNGPSDHVIQNQCTNSVAGCACSMEQPTKSMS